MRTIREVMTNSFASVPPNALIEDALELMLEHHVSGLPVIGDDGDLIGIITEYDILCLLIDADLEYRPIEPVAHYMTTQVLTLKEETSIVDAAELLLDESIRRLPVVRGSKVVGVVARRDIARAFRDDRLASFESLPENVSANGLL